MTRDFKVLRLSDEFGQYLLVIKCTDCAHERRAYPIISASLWMGREAGGRRKATALL
jgi:hypothetical protein